MKMRERQKVFFTHQCIMEPEAVAEAKPRGRKSKTQLLNEKIEKMAAAPAQPAPLAKAPAVEAPIEEPEEKTPIQAVKQKKKVADSTLAALARGREKINAINEEKRKAKEALIAELAEKKAEKMLNEKKALKKQFGLDDEESSDEEEVIVVKKTKKAPKKKVIYVEPESDDEDDVPPMPAPRRTKSTRAAPAQSNAGWVVAPQIVWH